MSEEEAKYRARSRRLQAAVLKPPPSTYRSLVASPGSCATVWVSEDLQTVIKRPFSFYTDGCDEKQATESRSQERESELMIEREKDVYRCLGRHPAILECLSISDEGIVFPFKRNGSLRDLLQNKDVSKTDGMKTTWIRQALSAFDFVHSKGVLQGDISARNFLVDDDQSIILCDFSGSAIGSQSSLVYPETRYGKPDAEVSLCSEIFAIGSLMYEICTDEAPYRDLDDEAVENLFSASNFPQTSELAFGELIRNCWFGHFSTVQEIVKDSARVPSTTEPNASLSSHDHQGRT